MEVKKLTTKGVKNYRIMDYRSNEVHLSILIGKGDQACR